jgi:voltage-gated potassium channel
MSVRWRLAVTSLLFVGLVAGGTAGYMLVEGWSFLDALYQTVTTLSTVGFREVHELSTAGRIFTMILIVGGVGVVFYTLTTAVATAVEGEFGEFFGRRRMQSRMAALHHHYLVCGFGRVGQEIAHELAERRVSFIVIDPNPDIQPMLRDSGYLYITGNATDDRILIDAGVRVAAGLLSAVDSDTDNTYIVLSARALNPSIFIVARAGTQTSEAKMLRAGADRVISPYGVAGRHMAITALQPAMVDFMSTVVPGRQGDLILAELRVMPASGLPGRTVGEVFPDGRSVRVLALQHETGELLTPPPPHELLRAHDQIIALGPQESLESITERTGGSPQTGGRSLRIVGPRLPNLARKPGSPAE